MRSLRERAKPFLRRVLWTLGTAVVYAALDRIAVNFQVEPGVSVLFPATAAAIVACMWGGLWGAAGVFLGSFAGPIATDGWNGTVVALAALNVMEGLIPWIAFRFVPGVSTDLAELKSLALFIIAGTVVNTGLSATLGTSLVGTAGEAESVIHQLTVWWIADFAAAVLLAMPVLAFGDRILRAVSPRGETRPPRHLYISGTLRVTAAIVMLGWGASAFVRNEVSNRIEADRLSQQQAAFDARNAVNHLHSNFLRAATLESRYTALESQKTLEDFEEARTLHFGLMPEVDKLVSRSTPTATDQFNRLRARTAAWFSRARREMATPADSSTVAPDAHQLSREFLSLRSSIENADALEWTHFRETRARLRAFHNVVDGLVFVILVVAFGTLITRISNPLDQISRSIELLGSGSLPPSRHGSWPFMELRTIDHALSSASRELKSRELELQQQTREAVEASRHKTAFLSKMSHELRTPLNAIIGFADLLRDPTLEDDRRVQFAENILHSARLLLTMIEDLLEIEKLESGSVSIHPRPCELGGIVRRAASSVASLLSEKNQRLDLRLPEGPLPATLDPEKLTQVLIRVLVNASKFSPQGERIIVRATVQSGEAEIEVEDRGVGVAPYDQERIFETFEQVYQKGVLSQGAGLGLTVAKRFIEAQGGVILVRNNSQRGATFTVKLPMEI